jgi:hypothetical protein
MKLHRRPETLSVAYFITKHSGAAPVKMFRRACRLPLAVGFGISRPEHASLLKPHVDAVVLGSAILSQIQNGYSMESLKDWAREMRTVEVTIKQGVPRFPDALKTVYDSSLNGLTLLH